MAKSGTSFGKFAGPCPSCKSKDALGRGRCPKCGAMITGTGKVFFKKGVQPPVEPVAEPVKSPVKTDTGSPSVSPSKKRSPSHAEKKPVKSPSKARVEPVTEPVHDHGLARDDGSIFDLIGF